MMNFFAIHHHISEIGGYIGILVQKIHTVDCLFGGHYHIFQIGNILHSSVVENQIDIGIGIGYKQEFFVVIIKNILDIRIRQIVDFIMIDKFFVLFIIGIKPSVRQKINLTVCIYQLFVVVTGKT